MLDVLNQMVQSSGLAHLTVNNLIMICLACFFLYLGIKKEYEPYLMVPIAFGILLVNLPMAGLMDHPANGNPGGLLYYLYKGTSLGIYPPLIFLCLGASTDFGPLIANPKTILLGGAAQVGIFLAFFLAIMLGMTPQEAASVGIIGGADGPTAIYVTTKLAPDLLSTIALAAYSYMALVPIIQPFAIKLVTTKKERRIRMTYKAENVSQMTKILFPIIITLVAGFIAPISLPLVGFLMFGNLLRECGVLDRLSQTAQNELVNIISILLGLTISIKMQADLFLNVQTLLIIVFGLLAFIMDSIGGVMFAKFLNLFRKEKINPMIGAAGISAFPMSSRVIQKMATDEDPQNFILMYAVGANVSGQIASVIAGGLLLAYFS
ncbi:TPA: sodium ion-translocating decarboxylase subunit beta [Streptococcus pyogenes]|nr:sodium ion-translocating decarboxylase subunit beta [Streptococcus pyogenes]HEP5317331.1 sodium ion-translocating decarboxylase subunit beta [Streptococcus pyogenes]HER2050058.1 sodium ion-translocating decarboxylase subunit beta [Streptococcus pyogenes]HES0468279.1 sodium ion-translocating decarboxylase subunit beta [Streptococcus pyogenes]HES2353379.1 sodium ion-translocating decarboxylase subunit beta [Streptococcus pyogenes]